MVSPPPEPRTGTNRPVRIEPGEIRVHTDWMYGDGTDCIDCPGRHAFARSGKVTASDWPEGYSSYQDIAAHVHRAIASFGDDVDLVITVARAGEG